ncbi:Dam family site-specific DNA-(adenine-N6)-methyltransferase [Candidatus Roizmanbacteria bacterium]|nr:Dam family site-specific DNA-(adenine-N6)-methyltransferase [Candidatus Roizmanbacteria bacterium]
MIDAGFGNKSSFVKINQRRYLGSKTRLLKFIEETLEQESVVYKSFADIFAGTGVVAHHFYNKTNIIVNDILDSNYITYLAFFGKEPIRLDVTLSKINEYNSIDAAMLDENYFSSNFSNTYFDHDNSKRIGAIRENIENLYTSGEISEREKAYLVTSLIYSLDRIANTVGHYDAYRKIEIPKKELVLRPLNLIKTRHSSHIYKCDANELVKTIKADVVYIDPPYNSRQYSDAYHLLENIASWGKHPVYGVAKKIDRSHIKSRYSLKSAGEAFSDLIDKLDTKYILVSYNDMGDHGNARSQSRLTDHEIVSALERRGKLTIYEKTFKQFTTGKSDKNDLMERIFFCRVENKIRTTPVTITTHKNASKREFVKSPLNYTGGKHKLMPQINQHIPKDIDTFYDIFCGGANVGVNAHSKSVVCVDKNDNVVHLLSLMKSTNFEELHQEILEVVNEHGLSQSYVNGYDAYGAESSKGLGVFNKERYLSLRAAYNKTKTSRKKTLLLLVLVMYSFNNQIRFNSKGEFNLPVGKRDYNGSLRRNLAEFNQAANDKNIEFTTGDFRDLLNYKLSRKDFVYLDPPYLLGLAAYNESGGWSEKDENDLYDVLTSLNKQKIRFALSNVIEHKGTKNAILQKWVERLGLNMHILNFDYKNSNYQSNAKNNITREVLVTNY